MFADSSIPASDMPTLQGESPLPARMEDTNFARFSKVLAPGEGVANSPVCDRPWSLLARPQPLNRTAPVSLSQSLVLVLPGSAESQGVMRPSQDQEELIEVHSMMPFWDKRACMN